MIMCVLLCYPVSIRIYYQQGVLFLVGANYSSKFLCVFHFRILNIEIEPTQPFAVTYCL